MGLTNISQHVSSSTSAGTNPTSVSSLHQQQASQSIGTGSGGGMGMTPAGVVVPVYAGWFEFGKIHEIEQRALPEFFLPDDTMPLSDKTPSVYCEYRDFMINTYRLRPHDYLTITTCRRHLAGDVGAIVRVHAFLEQWGLINFQAEAPGAKKERPAGMAQQHSARSSEMPAGMMAGVERAIMEGGAERMLGAPLGTISVQCTQCGVACPRLYYAQLKGTGALSSLALPLLALCALCYAEGRYPSNLTANDFQKVDVAAMEAGMRAPWSEEETLALLNAIEELQSDWDAVASRVGRPKDQCILRFLRLPLVEQIDQTVLEQSCVEASQQIPLSALPFGTAENPVMSTLVFLASTVHPKTAAAAAQAAIAEINRHATVEGEDGQEGSGKGSQSLAQEELAQVASTSLACAAARSHLFAEEEARKAARLRETLVDLQLQKLRVKMGIYEELERSLEEDRKELEQQRLQLFFDRFNLRKQMIAIEQKSGLATTSMPDGDRGNVESASFTGKSAADQMVDTSTSQSAQDAHSHTDAMVATPSSKHTEGMSSPSIASGKEERVEIAPLTTETASHPPQSPSPSPPPPPIMSLQRHFSTTAHSLLKAKYDREEMGTVQVETCQLLRLKLLQTIPESVDPQLYADLLPKPVELYWPWYRMRALEMQRRLGNPTTAISLVSIFSTHLKSSSNSTMDTLRGEMETFQWLLLLLADAVMAAQEHKWPLAEETVEFLWQLARKIRWEDLHSTNEVLFAGKLASMPELRQWLVQRFLEAPLYSSHLYIKLLSELVMSQTSISTPRSPSFDILSHRLDNQIVPLEGLLREIRDALVAGKPESANMRLVSPSLTLSTASPLFQIRSFVQAILQTIVTHRSLLTDQMAVISLDQLLTLQRHPDITRSTEWEPLCLEIMQLLSALET